MPGKEGTQEIWAEVSNGVKNQKLCVVPLVQLWAGVPGQCSRAQRWVRPSQFLPCSGHRCKRALLAGLLLKPPKSALCSPKVAFIVQSSLAIQGSAQTSLKNLNTVLVFISK